MIKYILDNETLNKFKDKYGSFIGKDNHDKIYTRCVFEGHTGNPDKVCAVLYKDSGVYSCPICGSCHVSTLLSGSASFVPVAQKMMNSLPSLVWDFDRFKLHFRRTEGNHIWWVNADKNNNILGTGKRIPTEFGRRYETTGKAGFRLFAPVITESLSEAVFLLEHGIDAGSITGVANIKKPENMKMYVPQNDPTGRSALQKLPPTTMVLDWYRNQTVKDIRELDDPSYILRVLEAFKLGE